MLTQFELATLIAKKLTRAGIGASAPEWMAANDGSTAVVLFDGPNPFRLTLTFGRLGWNLTLCPADDKAEILRIARAVIARNEVTR
mgnify:CR=1 FL=1